MDYSKPWQPFFFGQKCGKVGTMSTCTGKHVTRKCQPQIGSKIRTGVQLMQAIIIPEWKPISVTVFVGGNSNSPWSICTGELCRAI